MLATEDLELLILLPLLTERWVYSYGHCTCFTFDFQNFLCVCACPHMSKGFGMSVEVRVLPMVWDHALFQTESLVLESDFHLFRGLGIAVASPTASGVV